MGSGHTRHRSPGCPRHRGRLRHPPPAQGPRGSGHHRFLPRRPALPPQHASAGVGGSSDVSARPQRSCRHGCASDGSLPLAGVACGVACNPRWAGLGRAFLHWPARSGTPAPSTACRWRYLRIPLRTGAGRHSAHRIGTCRTRTSSQRWTGRRRALCHRPSWRCSRRACRHGTARRKIQIKIGCPIHAAFLAEWVGVNV